MILPLGDLNQVVSHLNKGAGKGKVISDRLRLDKKPSTAKMVILSVLTLGAYYFVNKYQHDKKGVFKKLTSEVDRSLNNYNKKVPYTPSLNYDLIQKNLTELQALKEQIQNFPGENFSPVDVDAREVLDRTLRRNPAYRPLKEQFLQHFIEKETEYKSKLLKRTPEHVDLSIDRETLKLKGRIFINLGEKYTVDRSHLVDLPEIKKAHVIQTIDEEIAKATKHLECKDLSPAEQEMNLKNAEIKKLQETMDHLSSIAGNLWKKDAQKLQNANQQLQDLHNKFKEKIDTTYPVSMPSQPAEEAPVVPNQIPLIDPQVMTQADGPTRKKALEEVAKFPDDTEKVREAVSAYGPAIRRATDRLRGDYETARLAVTSGGNALRYISKELKNHEELVSIAIKTVPMMIKESELKTNKEFLLKGMAVNFMIYPYLDEETQKDPDLSRIFKQSC